MSEPIVVTDPDGTFWVGVRSVGITFPVGARLVKKLTVYPRDPDLLSAANRGLNRKEAESLAARWKLYLQDQARARKKSLYITQ